MLTKGLIAVLVAAGGVTVSGVASEEIVPQVSQAVNEVNLKTVLRSARIWRELGATDPISKALYDNPDVDETMTRIGDVLYSRVGDSCMSAYLDTRDKVIFSEC